MSNGKLQPEILLTRLDGDSWIASLSLAASDSRKCTFTLVARPTKVTIVSLLKDELINLSRLLARTRIAGCFVRRVARFDPVYVFLFFFDLVFTLPVPSTLSD